MMTDVKFVFGSDLFISVCIDSYMYLGMFSSEIEKGNAFASVDHGHGKRKSNVGTRLFSF